MPPFIPTSREIFILTALLVSLLLLSNTFPSKTVTITDLRELYHQEIEDDASSGALPPTLEAQYTLQSLNAPLTWTQDYVPETRIVVHVPGESLLDTLIRTTCRLYWLRSWRRAREIPSTVPTLVT